MAIVNVPMGPAIVEYGIGSDKIVFDITKGGIVFTANTSTKDIKVDQYGDAPVKSIIKGGTAKVTVPFAVHDLDRLAGVIPNATLITSGTGPKAKKKIEVRVSAGFDLSSTAKPLVIKPTDPNATPNDWITVPLAAAVTDPEYTYDSDKERIVKVEFTAYVDFDKGGLLYIFGDETAKPETGK